MNEFQLRELRGQKREQINTARRFPTPTCSASFRFRDVTRQSSVKTLFHSRRLPRRHCFAPPLRGNERINPDVVKRIEFQGILGRIQPAPEIVAGVFGDARNHPRAGATGRTDDYWSRMGHANTCHGEG